MTSHVTANEAAIINQFFRANRTAKELNAYAEKRRLTTAERRQLLDAEYQREGLRSLVVGINARTLNNNKKTAERINYAT